MPFRPVPGSALDPDLGCGHEGGIKADPELADQVHILLGRLGQTGHKGTGAGVGDGAQIGLQLISGHADTGIGNGHGVLLFIEIDGDLQGHMGIEDFAGSQALVPEFFQGIGGIGDQFPDKDITLGIEGMNNDIE